MKNGWGKRWLYILVAATISGMFSSPAKALDVEAGGTRYGFHGFLESNFVLRDTDGFQYGFMDQVKGMQQRNTLKIDLDVYPTLEYRSLALTQIHLTFRAAYDTIFNMRDFDISKDSHGRFDYGLDDIKTEADLREAFIDVVYEGSLGSAFFRPGRQIVSWGETTGLTLLDIINPLDNSFQMFFQNPDDLMIPLWMGRLNYSLPPMPSFGLNFDFVVVPDIRPTQFSVLDDKMEAPYSFIFKDFAGQGFTFRQDVPTSETEYGVRVTSAIGDRATVSLSYFRDVVNDPGIELTGLGGPDALASYTHPKQHVYGGTFSYDVPALKLVTRGEFARYTDYPVALPMLSPDIEIGPSGPVIVTYRTKPMTQWMLGIDKDLYINFLTDREKTHITFEWVHTKINSWEDVYEDSGTAEDEDRFTLQMMWNWWNGRLQPLVFVIYSAEKAAMTRGGLKYVMADNWYADFALQAFWGDKDAKSQFAGLIGTSEMTFKLGFQW